MYVQASRPSTHPQFHDFFEAYNDDSFGVSTGSHDVPYSASGSDFGCDVDTDLSLSMSSQTSYDTDEMQVSRQSSTTDSPSKEASTQLLHSALDTLQHQHHEADVKAEDNTSRYTEEQNTSEHGYGYPFPFWTRSFPLIADAFDRAYAIFIHNVSQDKMSLNLRTKFKYRCNTAIVRDLFSNDQERISKATTWILSGYRHPPGLGKIKDMMGEENLWNLLYEVASWMQWSIEWTVYEVGKTMTPQMASRYKKASKRKQKKHEFGLLLERLCAKIQRPSS